MRKILTLSCLLLTACATNQPSVKSTAKPVEKQKSHAESVVVNKQSGQLDVTMQCAENAADRYKVSASHIVFFDEEVDGIGTDETYEKALRVRQEFLAGEDFAALAKQYSDGPSGPHGGILGFFVRGTMVDSFDRTAFCIPVREISPVIQTVFGYHLVLVNEERFNLTSQSSSVGDDAPTGVLEHVRINFDPAEWNEVFNNLNSSGNKTYSVNNGDNVAVGFVEFDGPTTRMSTQVVLNQFENGYKAKHDSFELLESYKLIALDYPNDWSCRNYKAVKEGRQTRVFSNCIALKDNFSVYSFSVLPFEFTDDDVDAVNALFRNIEFVNK